VVTVDDERYSLGGAANVARNLSSLGARVQLAGVVGEDEDGQRLRALCDELSIATDAIATVGGRKTTCKTRFVAGTQQVLRLDKETTAPLSPAEERELAGRFEGERVHAVVISDYAKGVVAGPIIDAALGVARRCGVPSVVDPKGLRFERYAGCTVITPNADEAAAAAAFRIDSDTASAQAGRVLMRAAGCEAVVVTRGRHGVSLVTAAQAWHLPAHTHDVFDVAGAGDTLVAAFTLALACGASLLTAVQLANVAAGLVVQASGVASVTREDLDRALAVHDHRQPVTSGREQAAR
jgi:D-beta-D-heptose 7-phosphate kinase/D-beta-D-heptose 1-phosphate adenosyltransferase